MRAHPRPRRRDVMSPFGCRRHDSAIATVEAAEPDPRGEITVPARQPAWDLARTDRRLGLPLRIRVCCSMRLSAAHAHHPRKMPHTTNQPHGRTLTRFRTPWVGLARALGATAYFRPKPHILPPFVAVDGAPCSATARADRNDFGADLNPGPDSGPNRVHHSETGTSCPERGKLGTAT